LLSTRLSINLRWFQSNSTSNFSFSSLSTTNSRRGWSSNRRKSWNIRICSNSSKSLAHNTLKIRSLH